MQQSPIMGDANSTLAHMAQIAEQRRAEENANAQAMMDRDLAIQQQQDQILAQRQLQQSSQAFQGGENQKDRTQRTSELKMSAQAQSDLQGQQNQFAAQQQGAQQQFAAQQAEQDFQRQQQIMQQQQEFDMLQFDLQTAKEKGVQELEMERQAAIAAGNLDVANQAQMGAESAADAMMLLQGTLSDATRLRTGAEATFGNALTQLEQLQTKVREDALQINEMGAQVFDKILGNAFSATTSKSLTETLGRFAVSLFEGADDMLPSPFWDTTAAKAKTPEEKLRAMMSRDLRSNWEGKGEDPSKAEEVLAVTGASNLAEEYTRNMAPLFTRMMNGDVEKAGAATAMMGKLLASLSSSKTPNTKDVQIIIDELTQKYGIGRDAISAMVDSYSTQANAFMDRVKEAPSSAMSQLMEKTFSNAAMAKHVLRASVPGLENQLIGRVNLAAMKEAQSALSQAVLTGQPIDPNVVFSHLDPTTRAAAERQLKSVVDMLSQANELSMKAEGLKGDVAKTKGRAELATQKTGSQVNFNVAKMFQERFKKERMQAEEAARNRRALLTRSLGT